MEFETKKLIVFPSPPPIVVAGAYFSMAFPEPPAIVAPSAISEIELPKPPPIVLPSIEVNSGSNGFGMVGIKSFSCSSPVKGPL